MRAALRTAALMLIMMLCACTAVPSDSEVKEDEAPQAAEEETQPTPVPEETIVSSYITPEQYGAKGDGIADDTEAFEQCMRSPEKNVLLSGKYRISAHITAESEKYFFAESENSTTGASVICEPEGDYKTLSFMDGVTFNNVAFSSTFLTTGRSPHGETYWRTSNVVFVEVWYKTGTFTNCTFDNALIAIRGRKTESSPDIPDTISVNRCMFTECKIPIQGYCENTFVTDSAFSNDGDLYGGDHNVYIERYGCQSLIVQNCRVDTKNCESGHAFQIYGKPDAADVIPKLTIENCEIYANGITSSSAAHVTVDSCTFHEQRSEQFILIAEEGTVTVRNCEFRHAYAFSYADSTVKPYAENCIFERLTSLGNSRCNFPQVSIECTYINWGGNVRTADTVFDSCTFAYSEDAEADGLYIGNSQGYSVRLKNTRFQKGYTITNDEKAVKENTGISRFN